MTEMKGVWCVTEAGTEFFNPCVAGKTSDGYHTFDELYEHRCLLFTALMKLRPDRSWRSRLHHDGSQWDGWFIVGMPIVGAKISLRFRIDWFNWLPRMPKYTSSLHWLWFTVRIEVEYGWSDRP